MIYLNYDNNNINNNEDCYTWYWGKNSDIDKYNYLLSMVLGAINNNKYNSYYNYVKDNNTRLSQELNNLSDFFNQINLIMFSTDQKKIKIYNIHNLRDENRNRFLSINESIRIYNVMNMKKTQVGGDDSNTKKKNYDNNNFNSKELFNTTKNPFNRKLYKKIKTNMYRLGGDIKTDISEKDLKKEMNLSVIPKYLELKVFREFNTPLNLNDVLLMSFSILPFIGWIFDIFMIFRALLERRWIYAILLTMNWYQWFFWKLISFGALNINISPLLKFLYITPYAVPKYFNIDYISTTFSHFMRDITNIKKPITVGV